MPNSDELITPLATSDEEKVPKGKALKDKLWGAASSYTEFEFDAHMAELKKLSPPAYEYLSKIP
ncbi:hypothetical protein FCV25MIE_19538, partial [Fagus crenata]